MNADDIFAFEHHLNLVASDPALMGSFSARYPNLIDLFGQFAPKPVMTVPGPFPAISNMTAIQTTLFDNWGGEKPVKNHPNRYGMALEVWTAPAADIRVERKGDFQHKGNVVLVDAKQLVKKVERLRSPKLRHPISVEYADALLGLAGSQNEGEYVGLVSHKSPADGTFFHDFQFVFVSILGTTVRASLYVDTDAVKLPGFRATFASGGRLSGAAVSQSRADFCGFSTYWGTE
jgi:hypothetical protein